VECVRNGYFKSEIEKSAYKYQMEMESGARKIIGVTDYVTDTDERVETLSVDPILTEKRKEYLGEYKARRNGGLTKRALEGVEEDARAGKNMMESVINAFESEATLGEVTSAMKNVFGTYEREK
jgi:methylmalonyl-CoA mutase N-terminal domain/subunit